MALQNTGEITVNVDRASAFAFARQPQQVAECIPGCHDLQEISPDRYSAVLTSEVAFMKLSFKVVVEVVKIDPLNAIEATATGDAIKLAGRLVAKASLLFTDTTDNMTVIHYRADVNLTGKLGGLGQPVLKAKSAEFARQFGTNLKTAIEKSILEKAAVPAEQEGASA
jgi:carbon monoxide dehydrogenase subunit G